MLARLTGCREEFCHGFVKSQGGFKIGARTAMSARSWLQIKFARTRLSALLWSRLCRAELYRRFLTSHSPPASNVLPIANRRLARSLPLAPSSGPLPRLAWQIPFAFPDSFA